MVAKRESGAGSKRSQVVQAFRDLLLCNWPQQRNQFSLEVRRIESTFTKNTCNHVDLWGKASHVEVRFEHATRACNPITQELVLVSQCHLFRGRLGACLTEHG